MQITRTIQSLGPIDVASVRRDPLLRYMILAPLFLALLVRFAVGAIGDMLMQRMGFDLALYYPAIMSYFIVLMIPFLFGVVIGFLLLDEKDADTLTALQVTPLPLGSYVAYRVAIPTVLSVVMTLVAFPITGLSSLSVPEMVLVALSAALLAPAFALFLGAFAQNKVQGFALLKGLGAILLVPVAGFFVKMPLQLLFGLLPTYWPLKAYWQLDAGQPDFWIYLLIGLVYQAALLALFLRQFSRVLHR
jgi:fluoroquinolone transport system permease protein